MTHIQGYNVNLLQKSFATTDGSRESIGKKKQVSKAVRAKEDDGEFDSDYVGTVDDVEEDTINKKVADGASKIPVRVSGTNQSSKRIYKNPLFGKIAIMEADYKCEYNPSHITFVSSKSGKPFMEAHHLLPAGKALEVWDKQGVNIDCVENLVSLCPNCHSAIHYGDKNERKQLIENLFNKKKSSYNKIGLTITLDDLLTIYKCK